MTKRYSEEQAIEAVALLTRHRLTTFIEAEIVMPLCTDEGMVFRQVDIARMELLCELTEEFSLDEDALVIVISLIDQLHAARDELRRVLQAVEAEPEEVRRRLAAALSWSG